MVWWMKIEILQQTVVERMSALLDGAFFPRLKRSSITSAATAAAAAAVRGQIGGARERLSTPPPKVFNSSFPVPEVRRNFRTLWLLHPFPRTSPRSIRQEVCKEDSCWLQGNFNWISLFFVSNNTLQNICSEESDWWVLASKTIYPLPRNDSFSGQFLSYNRKSLTPTLTKTSTRKVWVNRITHLQHQDKRFKSFQEEGGTSSASETNRRARRDTAPRGAHEVHMLIFAPLIVQFSAARSCASTSR